MNNKDNDHPSKLDGGGNKRKRSRNNKQQTDSNTTYNGISFNNRPSSGRPGSPHRYFDSSFDILMEDTTSDNVLGATSQTSHSIGNQVVHRHLNGLCIVTAGNIIQQQLDIPSTDDINEDGIQIKTIEYHIQPSKDSQSARGKMRTKKKKRKKQQHWNEQMNDINAAEGGKADGEGSSKIEVANHNGYVSPQDTLCTVTLSNGKEIQLKCCVEGTVIEINNRLVVDGSSSSSDTSTTTNNLTAETDVSLLIKEPLLDGYLAVIMPSRGVFPPK